MKRLAVFAVAVFALSGCALQGPPKWNGEPWTNTHPEPCRKFEPITREWVKAHPGHPCARLAPSTTSTTPPATVPPR